MFLFNYIEIKILMNNQIGNNSIRNFILEGLQILTK